MAEKSAERNAFILSWLQNSQNAEEPVDHIRNLDSSKCKKEEKEVKLKFEKMFLWIKWMLSINMIKRIKWIK